MSIELNNIMMRQLEAGYERIDASLASIESSLRGLLEDLEHDFDHKMEIEKVG